MDDISIQLATQENCKLLYSIVWDMKSEKSFDYFEHNLEIQDTGARELYVIYAGDEAIGYGILNWQPKYGFYKKLGIPEIQDLNIRPSFRQKGYASAFIEFCESRAIEKGFEKMGISVALDFSYGPAQRLYVKLGYKPDGNGVTYDREVVSHGDRVSVDDDLCLMMVKELAKTAP